MEEREASKQELSQYPPILRLSIPTDDLRNPTPPKGDPSFDLKYDYIDDKKIYHIIISANLLENKENSLLTVLHAHSEAIGYSLGDLKGTSTIYACIEFTWKKMERSWLIINTILINPNIEVVVRR
jgi:hypothetical protein